MSTLGFQEALEHSISVIIRKDPYLEVPVVSPQGLALLKIIAWGDREREKRSKDALDLAYLLKTYEKIGDISERVYGVNGLMESVDWDLSLACAYLLGQDAAVIAQEDTRVKVVSILDKALDIDAPGDLELDMRETGDSGSSTSVTLLAAFSRGFRGE